MMEWGKALLVGMVLLFGFLVMFVVTVCVWVVDEVLTKIGQLSHKYWSNK